MSFFIEKIIFFNRAPFDFFEINFNRSINIFTGVNGKGKTTILSHIADMLYEYAKLGYGNSFLENRDKFYRITSSTFSINFSNSSYVYIRFFYDEKIIDYIDCFSKNGKLQLNEYGRVTLKDPIQLDKIQSAMNNNGGFCKIFSLDLGLLAPSQNYNYTKAFSSNVITYFPSYRFEHPYYLNESFYSKVSDFQIDSDYDGFLNNPIEVVSDMRVLFKWVLDLFLDHYYLLNNNGDNVLALNDSSSIMIKHLNRILSILFNHKCNKNNNYEIRLGPRFVGGMRLMITDENKKMIVPSLLNLSAGELSLIGIFGEILRQSDKLRLNSKLENIKGVVIIDEIEKHLHIKLQYKVLPHLLSAFPNIQFILSSHSPFLNVGLCEELNNPNKFNIFDLDNSGCKYVPLKNESFLEVYNLILSENEKFLIKYQQIEKEIKKLTKPLILTEGKTDIKFILKAKEELNISDLDFDYVSEKDQPDGDQTLLKILENLSCINNHNIIIGIFDFDNEEIIKKLNSETNKFKSFGNKVFAFCIPVPKSRLNSNQDRISIEFLFSDSEIRSELSNGKKLFFSTDFNENSRCILDSNLNVVKPIKDKIKKIIDASKGQKVTDDKNNYLATKDQFAEAVIKGEIQINKESWLNFLPIFEKIREIIAFTKSNGR